jgi:two-component system cell cycle sensor histidine kinase/response regulator CckA
MQGHQGWSPGDDESPFEQLLEFAPDAIVGADEDGVIVLANHQTESLFGYPRGYLLGKHIELLVPERFHAAHPGHRRGYFTDPTARPMGAGLTLAACRRDGTEFPAEISLSSLESRGRRIALVAVRDVSERHNADQARARLAAIVDSSNDAIIGHGPDGVITSWNHAAERLYGYTPEEADGRSIEMLATPAGPGRPGPAAPTALHQHETEHLRKDGTRIEVALTVSHVRDEEGEVVGMATIARDISVQKRAARTFEGLLEFVPDAIVGVRADGTVTLANRQAESLFGYSRDELLGTSVEALVPERYTGGHAAHRSGYFEDPRTRAMGAGAELYGRRRDGSEFPAEISLSSLETDEGTVGIAAVRDISERAESERERALLEELNQARRLESVGQLAGGIAHDFNNLLGVIINFAKFVADELPPGSQADEDIEEVRKAARRGAELTRQLLIFSRREVVKPEVLDLNDLTAGLENLLRRALSERVTLEVAPGKDLWMIEADRGQLEQVLVNLAVNGRDAMPDGGKLVVETSNVMLDADFVGGHVGVPAGRYVRLTVSDSGVGMTADVLERAFEPFFTTKSEGEGTGLGLATVYGIVTEAGGHVALYSDAGVGTTVKIHLPATTGVPVPARPAGDGAPGGRGETLLVVEDEPEVRRMSERILMRAGYAVLSAGSGAEALELIAAHAVDLVLTDVVMPGMTGPQMVERLWSAQPAMKVIFMSGYSHQVLTHETLGDETRSAFIEKPFTAHDLQRTVRELLDAARRD